MGTQSAFCYPLIGARPYASLSIGARLHLILVNNKLRTGVVVSPRTSPVMHFRLRLGFLFSSDGDGDAYALLRAIAAAFFGTATYHHSASMVTEWAKELSMDQRKPSEVSQVATRLRLVFSRKRSRKKKLAQRFPIWRRENENHTCEGG